MRCEGVESLREFATNEQIYQLGYKLVLNTIRFIFAVHDHILEALLLPILHFLIIPIPRHCLQLENLLSQSKSCRCQIHSVEKLLYEELLEELLLLLDCLCVVIK